MLQNDIFLRALLRQPVDRTPVWMMRQAGRYLPEYRATRERAGSFLKLCMTPELACEVTLQPLARFPLDAAILFSDILTIPHALGLGLQFETGEGPRIERPVRSLAEVRRLAVPDPHRELRYVMDAVQLIRRELHGRVPLIGFAGSPFTLACYMIEGSGSDDWGHVKAMRKSRPDLLHAILEVNARAVSDYLNAQVAAGAQVVMVFDTWGGTLARDDYEPFSLAYCRRIFSEVKGVPRILFTRNGNAWLKAMMQSGCDAIGLDWTSDPREARRLAAGKISLQGNLDPATLFKSPENVREAAREVLNQFGAEPGHVFNLGHGILPNTPVDSVTALVDEVRTYSRRLRAAGRP